MSKPRHFTATSGETDPVWVHSDPYSNRPKFGRLTKDTDVDVCIVGAGIAGISTAYELVTRGVQVLLLDAREVLSGETGRTSGHLSSALDDHYTNIAAKHGKDGARAAAESHCWALERVGEIARSLGLDCEYRLLPAYEISQYLRGDARHDEEVESLKEEAEMAKSLGLDAGYEPDLAVRGWSGKPDQRGAAVFLNQAAFHPTKYLNGVLGWLRDQPNFACFTHTRMKSMEEQGLEVLGIGKKTVRVSTEDGHVIKCGHAVQATCVPLQKLSVIAEMEYKRTYCIAVRVPRGSVEDCLLYDRADPYRYVRLTACDDEDDYLVVGGCDHKVGQESSEGRFSELEGWVRERFPQAGSVDYEWSGQVFEPVDHVAFIGKNPMTKHTYVVTGDSGNGLTHGVLAGKLVADEIQGVENPWAKLYAPNRVVSILKSAATALAHDVQVNTQYKRFLQSDIRDIEDLAPGCGGVLNPKAGKPQAVYKDDAGNVHRLSALCPHLQGVVCWNHTEKSWDCPVHGSRFDKDGVCVMGPAKSNLAPSDQE